MISIPDGQEVAGSFRVEARLGSGAFGTVYRVEHRFLGRLALKLLAYDSDNELGSLANEAATHAGLAHPNITRVYDVDVTEVSGERFLYIASEYMPLGSLESYLNLAGCLNAAEWQALVSDLLGALEHAHSQTPSLLHRDITLGNILVGGTASHPVFKLGDFGISARLRDGRRAVAAAGTLLFLAPECGLGSYLKESDLYSAAVVLYKALTGGYPFPIPGLGNDPAAYEAKQAPLPPSHFLLASGYELDAVMLRALAPNPFDRYRSAVALKTSLLDASRSLSPPSS